MTRYRYFAIEGIKLVLELHFDAKPPPSIEISGLLFTLAGEE